MDKVTKQTKHMWNRIVRTQKSRESSIIGLQTPRFLFFWNMMLNQRVIRSWCSFKKLGCDQPWHSVLSQNNEILNYTTARTSKPHTTNPVRKSV